jgi:dTMP kinase
MARGLFVSFEGIDRSGKSTQCDKLIIHIKDCLKENAQKYTFPGMSFIYGYFLKR